MKTFLLLALLAFTAHAQEPPFPQRGPLEITVLFPAGSSADITARMLAEGMTRQLGQRVLVVNRPGAGGAIGYKYVAAQKPDGYSLVWNSNSISTTFHSGQLNFDYQAFDAVARVLSESVVVAVRTDAPWRTLNDLVAEAKAKPKEISVGHSGIGSHTHISLAALVRAAGVEVNEVPFAAAQVVPSLVGGHVNAVVQFPGALAAPMKQGQVRLLATLTQSRDPAWPDVPTARELGFEVALDAWRGIAVPRGTPRQVIA
jgi:tripartite-type tricarboxylate transporter receptor subunit TctC